MGGFSSELFYHILSNKTFIYFTGALGDFILFTAFIEGVLTLIKPTFLALAAPFEAASLFYQEHKTVTVLSNTQHLFSQLYSHSEKWDERLSTYLETFDLVIIFSADPEGWLNKKLKAAPLATSVHLFSNAPQGGETLLEKYQLTLGKIFPWVTGQLKPKSLTVDLTEKRDLLIQPGSGSHKKNWPLQNYFKLEDLLAPRRVTYLLGPAEQNLLPFFETKKIIFSISLKESLTQLKTCQYYLGNDSGFSHLISSLGFRGTILLPAENLAYWQGANHQLKLLMTNDIKTYPTPEDLVTQIEGDLAEGLLEVDPSIDG